jgi:hypothetical protein
MSAQNQQNQSTSSSSDLILLPILVVLSAWAMYTCWIVAGALVGSVIDGGIRVFATFVIAIGFPMLTALGFTNTREEGGRGIQTVNRVFIGATIVCAGTAFVLGVALAGKVVPELQRDPNWFLDRPMSEQGIPKMNRRYSGLTSNALCKTAHKAGTYYCP